MMYLKGLFYSLAFVSLLTACSGGGSSSSNDAELSSDNVKDLSVAAASAVYAASDSDDYSGFFKSGGSSSFDVISLTKQIAQNSYATEDLSSYFCDTGSAIADGSETDVTITFTSCSYFEITIDGTIRVRGSETQFTATYTLTVTEGLESETVSGSASCTVDPNTYVEDCTFSASVSGYDGRTYNTSDISVSESASGYTVSGTVTDPAHGTISITTGVPVQFNCPGDYPSSGQITVSSGGDTATVTFNDCDSFTVTFNGSSTTYNWIDI